MKDAQIRLDGHRWVRTPLPEILRELHGDQATGILKVGSSEGDREFIFVQGELRAARSTAESEKLGSWLVRHSLISYKRKEALLQLQESNDFQPLGHILVNEGILLQTTLEQALEGLAVSILKLVSLEADPACIFSEGRDQDQLDTLPGTTTPQLILLSARALDDLPTKIKALGSEEQHISLEAPLDEIVHEFDLTADEATLLGKLYVSRELKDLKGSSRMPAGRFAQAFYPLVMAGLVSLVPRPRREIRAGLTTGTGRESARPAEAQQEAVQEVNELKRLYRSLKRLNHYEFFGISAYAGYQDIFDAWEHYDRLYHPDRVSDARFAEYGEILKAVHSRAEEAYETLSNPTMRPRYDRILRAQLTHVVEQEAISENVSARESLIQENLREVESLIRREDFFSAIQLMERTTDLDPSPANLLKLAQLLLLNPRWTVRAMEKLKRALEADPKLVEGWLLLAEHWRRRKSPERERKALERALVADSGNSEALASYEKLVGTEAKRRFLHRLGVVRI